MLKEGMQFKPFIFNFLGFLLFLSGFLIQACLSQNKQLTIEAKDFTEEVSSSKQNLSSSKKNSREAASNQIKEKTGSSQAEINPNPESSPLPSPSEKIELKVIDWPVLCPKRKELTRQYAKRNYGIDDIQIQAHKMVVIHFTAMGQTHRVLNYMKGPYLERGRPYGRQNSLLNVAAHYVVSPNGKIYQLLPLEVMGRHIIGFNHVSIGIENVASCAETLTQAQLEANIKIIRYLCQEYPEMEFLIGHDEYMEQDLPHYKLFKQLDPAYQPYPKPDPGPLFMIKMRQKLKQDYGIQLKR